MKIYLFSIILVFLTFPHIDSYSHGKQNKKPAKSTESKYKFGDVEIFLKQIKGEYPTYCSASIEIKKDGKVLQERKYRNIEPLGGAYGLFVPFEQPSKKYFMVIKHGDYDGRNLLIDKKGGLIDLPGGLFFMTKNKRYLFVEHEQDCCGSLLVFDLEQEKIIFSDRENENAVSNYGDFESIEYLEQNKNVYVIFNYSDVKSEVYKYDFEKNDLVIANKININLRNTVNLYSQVEITEDCSCEQKKK